MDERREVRVIIGKRSYRTQTELDEFTLARVTSIVDEVCKAVGYGVDQESLLMLTCLQLAYNLERIMGTFEPLKERLDKLPVWEPLPEEE